MCLVAYSKVKVQSLRAKVQQRLKKLVDEKLETVGKIIAFLVRFSGKGLRRAYLGVGGGGGVWGALGEYRNER